VDAPRSPAGEGPEPVAADAPIGPGAKSKPAKRSKTPRRAKRTKKRTSSHVPWGDTESRPQRTAPSGATDRPVGLPTIKPAPAPPPDDDPPLLSPEELDALVGGPPLTPNANSTDPDHVP
jgi:hypothetical protein